MRPASEVPTVLLLVDVQEGFKHPTHWGRTRSTPAFEANVEALLRAARESWRTGPQSSAAAPLHIIHVHHHSRHPGSALHPSHRLPGSSRPSVAAMAFAEPLRSSATDNEEQQEEEPVITKHFNSAFVGTDLEARLRRLGARQLIVVGLTTDHCVSTTVRMAANLEVLLPPPPLGDGGSKDSGVVVVRDATATFERGGFDAETVHGVSLASLQGEFAEVADTAEVLEAVLGSTA